MKNKMGIGILITMLLIGAATVNGFGNEEFTDLEENHWSYQNVMELVRKNIVAGYPDGSFRPDQKVTYGEFLKMAIMAVKEEGPGQAEKSEHWAVPYYDRALEQRWFTSFDINKAAMDQPIPRAYMALIANGVLENESQEEWSLPAAYSEILNSIKDVDAATPYEYAIVAAYAEGILTGYPNQTFQPEGTLTRAESAAVIGRLMEKIEKGKEGIPPEKGLESGAGQNGATSLTSPVLKGVNLVEALISTYEEDIWRVYEDDPARKGPYYVGFKAGDTYQIHGDGMVEIVYSYPYSYDDRFATRYGLGILRTPDKATEEVRILSALTYLLPGQTEGIYEVFLEVAARNYQKNEHYMRKEYFGNRPVTMDVGGGCLTICIWPEGSKKNSKSWGVKEGEVKEEYYYDE